MSQRYGKEWLDDCSGILASHEAAAREGLSSVRASAMRLVRRMAGVIRYLDREERKERAANQQWRKRAERSDRALRSARRLLRALKKRKDLRLDGRILLVLQALTNALAGPRPR